jgi:hypothetical protein
MSATPNPFEPPKAPLEVAAGDAPPLWNPDAAGAWSIFFTPIFGSILVRKNWLAIGDEAKARQGTIWLVVSVLMLVVSVFFGIAAFAYLITWYFMWQRPQTRYVKERWGGGYPRKGWGVPLLIAFGVYVGLVAVLFGLGLLFAAMPR